MVIRKKVGGNIPPVPGGIMLGVLISVGITLLLTGVLAWLIAQERLTENSIGYGAMLILLAASAIGTLIAVKKAGIQRLLTAALTGAVYYLVLLAMNIIFFDGSFQGMGVTALVVIAGCGLVILGGLKGEKAVKKRVRRYRNR